MSPKQQRFASEYLVDLNATAAAIRAGFSKRTAAAQASRLLRNVKVRAAIDKGQKAQQQRTELSADWVISRLCQLADVQASMFYDKDGNLLPIQELPEAAQRSLCGLEVEEIFAGRGKKRKRVGVVRKIRWQKTREPLRDLGQHVGLFRDQLPLTADGKAVQVRVVEVVCPATKP